MKQSELEKISLGNAAGTIKTLEQKLEVKLSAMEERLQKDIAETGARYYGLIHEDLKSTFKANKDWLIGVPEKVSKLNAQAEENEYEHKEFKMRLGVLERSV
jgi:hypothetical protein